MLRRLARGMLYLSRRALPFVLLSTVRSSRLKVVLLSLAKQINFQQLIVDCIVPFVSNTCPSYLLEDVVQVLCFYEPTSLLLLVGLLVHSRETYHTTAQIEQLRTCITHTNLVGNLVGPIRAWEFNWMVMVLLLCRTRGEAKGPKRVVGMSYFWPSDKADTGCVCTIQTRPRFVAHQQDLRITGSWKASMASLSMRRDILNWSYLSRYGSSQIYYLLMLVQLMKAMDAATSIMEYYFIISTGTYRSANSRSKLSLCYSRATCRISYLANGHLCAATILFWV
jgi:hypothetical protein